jgi:hypothetical protein
MHTIEKRALYNLLRLNWLNNPTMKVEPWQVENYDLLTIPQLFDRLKTLDLILDKLSFITYAEDCDSPEELALHLTGDRELTANEEDHIYLLVFELWRRLVTEKPSLSILCHEIDEQIYLYDQGQLDQATDLQNALTQFIQVLDQNVDEGLSPSKAFELLLTYCANDVETFLYDFISEQIDEENETYALDLLDTFDVYLANNKWFELLHIRLSGYAGSKTSQKLIGQIIEKYLESSDLEFKLELLSILIERGDPATFHAVLKQTFPLIQIEEEWQDLLAIGIDYLHRLDQEESEKTLLQLVEKRKLVPLNSAFHKKDPDFKKFAQIFDL